MTKESGQRPDTSFETWDSISSTACQSLLACLFSLLYSSIVEEKVSPKVSISRQIRSGPVVTAVDNSAVSAPGCLGWHPGSAQLCDRADYFSSVSLCGNKYHTELL